MTPLNRHFLENLLTDFHEPLAEDVKLMLDRVLKVLCRYLLLFLAEMREGKESAPSPS